MGRSWASASLFIGYVIIVVMNLQNLVMDALTIQCACSLIQVCNFMVGLFFLELVDKLGVAPVYAGFGGVSLLSAIFAYYFIVETKGRSLEEIEMSLNRNFPSRDQ